MNLQGIITLLLGFLVLIVALLIILVGFIGVLRVTIDYVFETDILKIVKGKLNEKRDRKDSIE